MPAVTVAVIIVLLTLALIYAWRSPEINVCVHCLHTIQRSTTDDACWSHCDSGKPKCWPDHDDSPTAEPHPHIVL